MDKILDLLNEIPEKEIPEDFEKTLSLRLKQEARTMKRKKRTRGLALVAASFLVVFGSFSVYNELGGFKGGGYDDSGIALAEADDSIGQVEDADYDDFAADGGGNDGGGLEALVDKLDEGKDFRGRSPELFGSIAPDYIFMLEEYLGDTDYVIEDFIEKENGDLVFHLIYKGEKLVLIGRSGEFYVQEGEEQEANSN